MVARLGLIVLAALAGGCDSASPYRTTLRDQTGAVEELAKILSTITDQASMKAARAQLDTRFDNFESIGKRAQKMPRPTQDIMRQVQEDGEKLREALEKVREQVRRIQVLPGGPEFLGSFERMKGFWGDQVP